MNWVVEEIRRSKKWPLSRSELSGSVLPGPCNRLHCVLWGVCEWDEDGLTKARQLLA